MEQLSSAQEIATAGSQRVKPDASILFKRYFLLALLLCTWLPIAFFILLAPPEAATGGLAGIKTVFLFLGTAHVPATLFFYTDKEFFGIIKGHKLRYVYLPIFLTLTTGLLFAVLSNVAQAFLLLAYWSWQAFHYGRQNIGVYAFASIAQTGTAPHRAEKMAIDFGTILGILGTFKILGTAVAPTYLYSTFDHLYLFGSVTFAAVLIFSLAVYAKFYRDTTVFKTLFFFTSVTAAFSSFGVTARESESPLRITLVQSVPKGDKMEAIVRAATELGVAHVVPALTARTVVTLEPSRWRDRARRWQRVAKEAAKQCGRAVVPPVDIPRPLADVLALDEPADLRLCLWEGAIDERSGSLPVATLADSLPAALDAGSRIHLLVGPEGGLSREEVESARAHRWTIVGMGPRILRTETAGPAVIAVLQSRFGDLGARR